MRVSCLLEIVSSSLGLQRRGRLEFSTDHTGETGEGIHLLTKSPGPHKPRRMVREDHLHNYTGSFESQAGRGSVTPTSVAVARVVPVVRK